MAFGKRVTPPKSTADTTATSAQTLATARAALAAPDAAPSTTADRLVALRETMMGLFIKASRIANAVKEDGGIEVNGVLDEPDPFGDPLNVRGFEEHFMFFEGSTKMNSVFVYADVPHLDTLDPNAQLHLHLLLGRIHELNRFCQQAVIDGALRIALQSPKMPPLIDRIVVGTAFFVSLFENAEIALPYLQSAPMRAMPSAEVSRLREGLERHRLMAFDTMIAPHTLEEMLPTRKWPIVAIETKWPSHPGEQFVNGVYFPAQQGAAAVERVA